MIPANETEASEKRLPPQRYFRRRVGGGTVGVDARDSREAQAWLVERRRSSPAARAEWERAHLRID